MQCLMDMLVIGIMHAKRTWLLPSTTTLGGVTQIESNWIDACPQRGVDNRPIC